MPDFIDEVRDAAVGDLANVGKGLAGEFLGAFAGHIQDVAEDRMAKVLEVLEQGADFKVKALSAQTEDEATMYREAVQTSVRRFKTILTGERVVAEEKTADFLARAWDRTLEGLARAAQGTLSVVVAGLVGGVFPGAGSLGGLDPARLFPHAQGG